MADRKSRPRRPRRAGGTGRSSQPNRPRFSNLSKSLALWLLIILLPLTVYQLFMPKERAAVDIKYSEFVEQLDAGNVESVTITERQVNGVLRQPARAVTERGSRPYEQFRTVLPFEDPDLVRTMQEKGVAVEAKQPPINWFTQILAWLPWILIIAFWIFFVRQIQGGGSKAFSFGKSRAKLLSADAPKVTFDDVAGCDEAKQELEEIIEFLRDPKKFQRLGGRIPKGVLLLGPPGTGKTLLARAVAGEAGVPFFSMSGSDFVEMFVGVGASVTGDTRVLIRTVAGTELVPIGDFVDRHYRDDAQGFPVLVEGIETIGLEGWTSVGAVYRHRVDEIYEVRYVDGTLRATGDHSVFVRRGDAIEPVQARDLRAGDELVALQESVAASAAAALVPVESLVPMEIVENGYSPVSLTEPYSNGFEQGAQSGYASTWDPVNEASPAVVLEIERKPYEGYVYDLCGCENEAFFGGEKPVLLHNSRVRDLFEQGKAHAPCIIFIDEIDAVGRHRGAGLGGGHDEREQTLNQLLVEMDGFESNQGVILIAATNRPDVLDPALLRPGRFDRQVVVDRPDVRGREGIFKVHTREIPIAPDVDLHVLAKGTPGLAGADLENIVNEAALWAARQNRQQVTMEDFEAAKDKVMMGAERKSLVITEDEKRSIAYHEGGHALVRMLTPGADPVHKVTIIPRGRALGVTHFLPVDERHIYSRHWCEDQLVALLGGRAAEVLVLGDTTTGAGDDLQRATDLARRMVTKWGMSEVLGPLTYGDEQEQIFLGREIATHRDYSEETARLIDQEVKTIVETGFDRAVTILKENEETLHRLAEELLEREILDHEEIERVMAGQGLEPIKPVEEGKREEPSATQETVEAALGVGDDASTPDTAAAATPGQLAAEATAQEARNGRPLAPRHATVARAGESEEPLASDG
jgi:ATP-dependent metalloprotease FtsH